MGKAAITCMTHRFAASFYLWYNKIMPETVSLHIVCVTAVIIRQEKFLAGLRSEKEIAFPGMWEVIGGRVDGKDSLEYTLRKEIREEANVEVKDFKYIGEFEFTRPDGYHVVGLEYVCEYLSGQEKSNDPDMVEVRWMTIGEAEKLNFIPGVLDYVKKGFEIIKRK